MVVTLAEHTSIAECVVMCVCVCACACACACASARVPVRVRLSVPVYVRACIYECASRRASFYSLCEELKCNLIQAASIL